MLVSFEEEKVELYQENSVEPDERCHWMYDEEEEIVSDSVERIGVNAFGKPFHLTLVHLRRSA